MLTGVGIVSDIFMGSIEKVQPAARPCLPEVEVQTTERSKHLQTDHVEEEANLQLQPADFYHCPLAEQNLPAGSAVSNRGLVRSKCGIPPSQT